MAIVSELQMFPIEELSRYDEDERYSFIFVTREQIVQVVQGYLTVESGFIEAVDDTYEWIRFHRKELLDSAKVFALICQDSKLFDEGFISPEIVDLNPKDWTQKLDDGFKVLRINHSFRIEPVGYCAITQQRKHQFDREGLKWNK